jgi:hypothetical protein
MPSSVRALTVYCYNPLLSNKGESPLAQAGRDSVLLSLLEMAQIRRIAPK